MEFSPGLRTSELILCAYTFLGFNIKDIADYTFKSVNTIRNRKQNLRKKFGLSGEQDMGIWLRNLIDNKS
jgi:DNA-binding NarL/FixJ family response regulator